jgi:translation initiation factor IF-1
MEEYMENRNIVEGIIIELLRDAKYKVNIQNIHGQEYEIICYTSGRIRRSKVRILVGDKVEVEMEGNNGRILSRIE